MSLTLSEIKQLEKYLREKRFEYKIGLENFLHTVKQNDAYVIDVENRAALTHLMRFIHGLNKGKKPEERIVLRAAAGGRDGVSYSNTFSAPPVINADIVIRLTGREFTSVIKEQKNNVVTASPNMQIGELDKRLYQFHGKVLPTASLIPYVTVAGLTAPGGHGTGKDQPSFSGLVRGMTICKENGDIEHIDSSHPDFETIRGAHNGLFGIILDMDIQCAPAQKLQCVIERRSASEFMEAVEQGLFDNDPYVSAMYVPTYLPDEMTNTLVNNVVIYRWRPVPLDTPDVNSTPVLDDFTQKIQQDLDSAINISEILRKFPHLTPYYTRYFAAPISVGKRDELSVGPWHSQMHYRTEYPDDVAEICGIFAVKDHAQDGKKRGQEMVRALKYTIESLEKYARRGQYPISYALYFRFIKGTPGGLSPTAVPEGHHVCALDLTTRHGMPGFNEFEREARDFFINELNGKFHWGKNAPADLDYEKMYGEEWKKTRDALDRWNAAQGFKTENSVFMNPVFSTALKYPVPTLEDKLVALPEVVKPAHQQTIAINAGKLLDLVGDNSEDCKKLRAEIDGEIRKTNNSSIFSGNKKPQEQKGAKHQRGCCVIL